MLLFTMACDGSCFGKEFECYIQSENIFKAVDFDFSFNSLILLVM